MECQPQLCLGHLQGPHLGHLAHCQLCHHLPRAAQGGVHPDYHQVAVHLPHHEPGHRYHVDDVDDDDDLVLPALSSLVDSLCHDPGMLVIINKASYTMVQGMQASCSKNSNLFITLLANKDKVR